MWIIGVSIRIRQGSERRKAVALSRHEAVESAENKAGRLHWLGRIEDKGGEAIVRVLHGDGRSNPECRPLRAVKPTSRSRAFDSRSSPSQPLQAPSPLQSAIRNVCFTSICDVGSERLK